MTNQQLPKKTRIKNFMLSKHFFAAAIILAAVFFLMFASNFKAYTSSVTVLVNAKSEIAARQQTQVVANIAALPETLAFYDRMLKANSDVRDVAEGLSQDRRKRIWNDMLGVKKIGNDTTLIRISITSKQEADADKLASKAVRSLFDSAAIYYNVKDDVDMRIIDGPISHAKVQNWAWLIFSSILFGVAVTLLGGFIWIFEGKEGKSAAGGLRRKSFFDFKKKAPGSSMPEITSLEQLYQKEEGENVHVWKETVPSGPQEILRDQDLEFLNKIVERGTYPNFPEMPVHGAAPKSSAPDNLPIADISFLGQDYVGSQQAEVGKPELAEKEIAAAEVSGEPTPEELKKKLNQLLRGEL